MKKWTDNKKRHLNQDHQKRRRKLSKCLMRRYEEPYQILHKVGKASYRVELPPTLKKLHPIFHVSWLKPYHRDEEDPTRGELLKAPPSILTSFDKRLDHIKLKRVVRKPSISPHTEYLIFGRDY
uniref:Tf2-1-like SH3-like domain-containing protein n=1 Tax=Kalanchoe fedtschenkoi TaxID=63787 RepID=A0A7N0TU01_KALFE